MFRETIVHKNLHSLSLHFSSVVLRSAVHNFLLAVYSFLVEMELTDPSPEFHWLRFSCHEHCEYCVFLRISCFLCKTSLLSSSSSGQVRAIVRMFLCEKGALNNDAKSSLRQSLPRSFRCTQWCVKWLQLELTWSTCLGPKLCTNICNFLLNFFF